MYRIFTLFLLVACLSGCFGSGGGGGGGSNNGVPDTNADLFDLSLSAGPLDQVFQANQLRYTATVGFLAASTTVTPTTDAASATVTVNGVVVVSGTASGLIALDEGPNEISVTVTAEDGITTKIYTIGVTRELADEFAQQAYLNAFNAEDNDQFGFSISLSDDTLAVGAVGKNSDINNDIDIGAVYVFTRDIDGLWSQQAYLKASNAEDNDQFGFSVALSGDTLAVGAVGKNSIDNIKPDIGAVYVFTRDIDGNWTQQALLRASNAEVNDQFGFSISLSNDTLAVGAVGKDIDAGAVYVFTRDNAGDWRQQDFISAFNAEDNDQFGFSISLSSDTLAVGAVGKNSGVNNDIDVGAVYVFIRENDGVWRQQDFISASNAEDNDQFGFSISLSSDTLAVGAVGKNIDAGAVYVFTRDNVGDWRQQDFIRAFNAEAGDLFGGAVALAGDTLAVGAVGKNSIDNIKPDIGAVYVFIRDNEGEWGQQDFIRASNAEDNDQFGFPVSLSGDTLAVGAVGKNIDAGAVYVFQ